MSDLLDLIKGGDEHHAGVRKAQELDRQKADKFLMKGGGEGSRGGNVIGHTSSGKPIYASSNKHAADHKHLDAADHKSAHETHQKLAQTHHDAGEKALAAGNTDKAYDHWHTSDYHVEQSQQHELAHHQKAGTHAPGHIVHWRHTEVFSDPKLAAHAAKMNKDTKKSVDDAPDLLKGGGWMPFGSKHDGLRKRNAKGGFDYWYPDQNSYKRGKATGEHSTHHTGRHDDDDHKMHVGPERHDALVIHHQKRADSHAADFKGDNSHHDNMIASELKHSNAMRMASEAALRGDGADQAERYKLAEKHRKEAVSHHDAHWDEHHAKQAEVRKLDKKVISHHRSSRGQEVKVVAHVDKNGEAQGHSIEQSWDSAKPGTTDYAGGAHSDPTVSGHSTLESAKQHALQIISGGSSPFDRATKWSEKGEKKTGYSNTEIKQGLSGRGHANFTVQATKHLSDGRKQNVSQTFETKAEAKSWIEHAMPGNDYKKSVDGFPKDETFGINYTPHIQSMYAGGDNE